MEKLDKRVAESLTRFYIVALFVIAFLTISGLFLIRKTISSLNHDGRIVNVAGRQRMLSQRLTKLTIARHQGLTTADSVAFEKSLKLWKDSHEQLANRRLEVDGMLVTWKSEPLDRMFRELQPAFDSLYYHFVQIQEGTPGSRGTSLDAILKNETVYLAKMNEIVYQFDQESFARLNNLERIEWILDLMTVLVLLAEGLLIFRPVVNTTRRVIRMLTESEENLNIANQKLKATNLELLRAQENLARVEQEKYQWQLNEERVRAAALIEGQEEERKRFALELHDGIGQMLTGLKLHSERLQELQFHDEKQQKRFGQLVQLIQETIQATRQVSFNLMPSVLSDFGIGSAIKVLCKQTMDSAGVPIDYQGEEGRIELPANTEIALYRIAQEALNNAVKHARASEIIVRLQKIGKEVSLTIQDNGQGFDTEAPMPDRPYGLGRNGLENMQTRSHLINGIIQIESSLGIGSKIMININL
ncbi:ATP-binding protein [Dyadobacter tibetensis]|uniref:ATP-binding protein n=1 Tax=Dyadobacter tibetensis TaxID=1211851 RepID=UPI00046E5CF2|nr:histidine kinase [Dyadobacter tibetensis]